MEYIDGTALDGVSRFGFGCEQLGGVDWGQVDVEEIASAIRSARSQGVNFFDTAPVYGLGLSESRLGAALAPIDDSITIATKGGLSVSKPASSERAQIVRDSSRRALVDGIVESCERLGIASIPAFFVHWPDKHTPIRETMEALMSLKEAGKIGAIGLSNFDRDLIVEARRFGDVDAVQVSFSLLDRTSRSTVDLCRSKGIAVCAYGVLAQGLLTGKYSSGSGFGTEDRRHRLAQFSPERIADNLKLVDRLSELAKSIAKKPAQVAIRYALQYPGISAVIIGIKSKLQFDECSDVFDWSLTQAEVDFLEK